MSTTLLRDCALHAHEAAAAFHHLCTYFECFAECTVKCDTLGNVYAGCGDGLHVWSESVSVGKILSLVSPIPSCPTRVPVDLLDKASQCEARGALLTLRQINTAS